MKNKLILIVSMFFILSFVNNIFAEISADKLNAILQENGALRIADLSPELRQKFIDYQIDYAMHKRKISIVPEDAIVVTSIPQNTRHVTFLLEQTFLYNGFEYDNTDRYYLYSPSNNLIYNMGTWKITNKTGLDVLKNEGIFSDEDIQKVYQHLGISTGQSFTVTTGSYNGICYKLVGGGTSDLEIYKSKDNGATWNIYKK